MIPSGLSTLFVSIIALNTIPGNEAVTEHHFILIVCFISLPVALNNFDSSIIFPSSEI